MYLKDLVDIQMGQSPDSKFYNNDKIGLPFYQGKADFGRINPIPKIWCSKSKKEAKPNDILISVRAPVGDLNINNEQSCIGRGLAAITCRPDVDMMYLYYYLKYLKPQLKHISTGSTFESINRTQLENLIINYKPYLEQIKISNILQVVERQIEVKENLLSWYDLLVKSRFVEMFEVFNINPNNYNTIKFKDLIERNNINEEDKVWLLNLDMIKPNTGEIVEKVYINRQNIPASSISFKKGTVLYSKLRPYLNKVVIADENGYGTSELIPLNSYKNGLTAEYLAYYLRQDSFVDYIKDKVTGAKMPRVAMDILRNIDIIQPNYIYQEQFSSFVNHVNKLKSDVQKSIDETQLLMDSLMQEYFG